MPGQLSAASIIEVDDDAAPGWYDATHVHTITEAMAVAVNGDSILVHPGTYSGTVTVDKRVSIASTDGPLTTIVQSSGTYAIDVQSDWVNLTGLTVQGADNGINVQSADNCTVKGCIAQDNDLGIRFYSTKDSRLEGCNVTGSKNYGIYLWQSPGILARGNWVHESGQSGNDYGGLLIYSDGAILEGNRFLNNTGVGLRIYTCDQTRLENNSFQGNGDMGLSLEVVTATRMRNNTFRENRYDLYLLGNSLATFQQDIDPSNQVGSGPIYYFQGGSDFTVPSDAGMVGLVQCTNVTVQGLNISNGGQGVLLAHSSGCTLEDIATEGCYIGCELYYSSYNTVQRCLVNGSGNVGATLYMSPHNLIADSSFTKAVQGIAGNGVFADFSHNTRVERCNMSSNHLGGVYIRNSNHCHVNDSLAKWNEHGNGIFGYLSNYMGVRGNNVSGNGNGILISQSSSHCAVEDNQVFDNTQQSSKRGIEVYYSDLATLTNNTVAGNRYGIWVYSSDDAVLRLNTVRDSQEFGGIYVYGALTVILENNTAEDNVRGIYLSNPGAAYKDYNNSVIANNTLLNSGKEGFKVDGRLKNATIAHNVIEGAGASDYGIYLDDLTRDNLIFDNRIVCPWNAYDAGTNNTWNVSKAPGTNIMGGAWLAGNYFSNYTGPDADSDGIGDVPFSIAGPAGGQDLLPLATPYTEPSAPLSLVAIGGVAQVQLSWSPPSDDGGADIMSYSVYRGTTTGSLALLTSLGNVTSYLDQSVSSGQTYYYAVSAHNLVGEGPRSGEALVVLPTVPTAPVLIEAVPGVGQVQLSWSSPADDGGSPITNFSVYRGTSASALSLLVELGVALGYLDTDVDNGVTYYYGATAINAVGEGPMSNVGSATPPYPLTLPTVTITSPSNGSLNRGMAWLNWTGSDSGSGIAYFEVQLDSQAWINKSMSLTHTFSSLGSGTHKLSVRAWNNAGQNRTAWVTVTTDLTPPAALTFAPTGQEEGLDVIITVTVSESMATLLATVNGEQAMVTWAGLVATIAPASPLQYGTDYQVRVNGTDQSGWPMSELVFGFRTTEESGDFIVTGTVVDEDGDPVAGATVTADGHSDTTDSQGDFELTLPPGTYTITVVLGERTKSIQFAVTEETLVVGDIVLPALPDEDGGGTDWLLLILLIAAVLVILLLLLLFWKRRRKQDGDEPKG